MSRVPSYLQALTMLMRSQATQTPPRWRRRVRVFRQKTAGGVSYDLYQPGARARKTVVVIHGITYRAERDPRLIRFAYALAMSNIRVAAISLPFLKSYRFDVRDVDQIAELVTYLHQVHRDRIGLIGFSFGASLGALALLNPGAGAAVDPVLLFGAYYDLPEVIRTISAQSLQVPTTVDACDVYIWLRAVAAYKHMAHPSFPEARKKALVGFLADYCTEPDPASKYRFFQRYLNDLPYDPATCFQMDPAAIARLSLTGKAANITNRVVLLHDAFDPLIPPSHSAQMYAQLRQNPAGGDHRLIITPLLSHVMARYSFNVGHFLRIVDAMTRLFD